MVLNVTWKIMGRVERYATLIFIKDCKVEEFTLPANSPLKKFASIIRLRSANEAIDNRNVAVRYTVDT